MTRFRRLLRLSSRERRLLLAAGVVVACVRVLLWLLPFSRLVWLLERTTRRSTCVAPVHLPDDTIVAVSWAVTVAARYVPRATCLTQSLAAQWLFAWFGHPTVLRIGVAKANDKSLLAHAWLESEGRVVLGGESLQHDAYAVLSPLP